MKVSVTSASERRATVADWLDSVVPDWLAEVMVPKKAAPPWGTMARAVVAIWAPLAVGFIAGHREIGLLPAMGGLLSIMIDNGGTLRARVRRVGTAAIFGGALGVAIGSLIYGRGWVAVIAIVIVAGVSSLMARLGGIGSVTGLQLMVYTAICLGPFGALRPWWHTAIEFVAGAAWALLLIVPGWLLAPRAVEQGLVADVYHRIADGLRAAGTPGSPAARQNVTAALNAAYDGLLTRRSASSGRSQRTERLMAILNASHQMVEAAAALRYAAGTQRYAAGAQGHEAERTPPWVTDTVDRLADLIAEGQSGPLPLIPPQWSASDGALALRDSLVALTRVISGNEAPPSTAPPQPRPRLAARVRAFGDRLAEQLLGGRIAWTFTIRLMLCTGVAAVMSEVLPLTRSYWVVMTVAVVLKPDYGSVFTRALQRGIGTIIGACLGAAILAVVPYGPWLLIPFGVLAALLPYGKARSFGLSAVFLTPFVVLLIDLLEHTGWRLAGDRALDTVLGSAIVLIVGYAPWPVSWQAHLPSQFAETLRVVCAYIDEALVSAWGGEDASYATNSGDSGPARQSRLRRQAFRSLSDLRAEFQRTLSEPERVSRRAAVWWPAVVGLEELLDSVTTVSLAIGRGAPAPDRKSVNQITGTLRAVADAMEAGRPPMTGPLPSAEDLRPVTEATRSVLAVFTPTPQAADETGEPGIVPDNRSLAETDVQGLASRFTDHVEGDQRDDQDDRRRIDHPPVAVEQVVQPVRQHGAPVGGGRRQAQAEEAEHRQHQDRVGHGEGGAHDDHAERVRHQVTADSRPLAAAERLRGLDVLPCADREDLAPDETGRAQPGQRRQEQDDHQQVRREDRHQDEQQDQRRQGQERVDHAHHDHVDDAARPAGDRAVEGADHRRGDGHGETELKGRLAADHQPAEDVVTVPVRAERMAAPRRQGGVVEVHRYLVGVVEQRAQEAERDQHQHDGRADLRPAIAGPDAEGGPASPPRVFRWFLGAGRRR
jgi:uncharacterized membrane protein YccC